MIKQLRVSHYRSLGSEVILQLQPLTVLVGQNGSGKSNVVDVLRFVSDCMGKLTDDIEDLEIRSAGGYLIARFKHTEESKRGKWFDAAQESDGTLRVAGMLTALLQDPTLAVLGIEEPELTVHPGAIPLICDFIRQASKNSQIILTTHSPELLEHFDVDEIRVVERRQGETTVAPLDANQRELVRKHLLTLGEMLRTEGLKQQIELAV